MKKTAPHINKMKMRVSIDLLKYIIDNYDELAKGQCVLCVKYGYMIKPWYGLCTGAHLMQLMTPETSYEEFCNFLFADWEDYQGHDDFRFPIEGSFGKYDRLSLNNDLYKDGKRLELAKFLVDKLEKLL